VGTLAGALVGLLLGVMAALGGRSKTSPAAPKSS